jgi:hypothetical protein
MSRKRQQRFAANAFLAICLSTLTGFGAKHSTVKTKVQVEDNQLTVDFMVEPNEDMQITIDQAPWSLSIKEATNLTTPAAELNQDQKSFRKDLSGFQLTAPIKEGAKSGELKYQLKAFICTKDKTRCYPQFHNGQVKWQR